MRGGVDTDGGEDDDDDDNDGDDNGKDVWSIII